MGCNENGMVNFRRRINVNFKDVFDNDDDRNNFRFKLWSHLYQRPECESSEEGGRYYGDSHELTPVIYDKS